MAKSRTWLCPLYARRWWVGGMKWQERIDEGQTWARQVGTGSEHTSTLRNSKASCSLLNSNCPAAECLAISQHHWWKIFLCLDWPHLAWQSWWGWRHLSLSPSPCRFWASTFSEESPKSSDRTQSLLDTGFSSFSSSVPSCSFLWLHSWQGSGSPFKKVSTGSVSLTKS